MTFEESYIDLNKKFPEDLKNFNQALLKEHNKNASEQTLKLINSMEESQKMVYDSLREFKQTFKEFCEKNEVQHKEIIARQDHTNGSIGKLKKSQLILRTILATAVILLAVLGLLPARVYDLIKLI